MASSALSEEEKEKLRREVNPIVEEFIREKLIGKYPISNSFKTLEQLGFFIVRFPAGNNDLSGFHIKKSGIDCIFINGDHTLGRQYYSGWHECYHSYTGEESDVSLKSNRKRDPVEYKAEYFAGCILMPTDLVDNYIKKYKINLNYLKHTDLIIMQNYFSVSYSAMVTRIIELYPEEKGNLGKYYVLGSINQRDRLLEKTDEANELSILITKTEGLYITESFFKNIQFNLKENRISKESVASIIELIERLKVRYGE